MRSANITELFDAGFNFARHLPKANTFEGQKSRRKNTTHLLEETKISVVATPLKRWPKHKSSNAGYGKPRYMQVPTTKDNKLEIPIGATHLEYKTSRIAIVDTINHVNDFIHMRGELRFGKYHLKGDRFEYFDKGTERVDGTCEVNKAREREEELQVERVVREPELAPAKAGKLPKPPKAKIATTPANAAPAAQPINRERGKLSGFIDALIMEGMHSVADIVAQVVATFPDRTPQKAKGNVLCRHFTLKAAKKNPPPFAK